METDFNWIIDHWWLFAILILCAVALILYAFVEATRFYTGAKGPVSAIISFKFWKWFFKCCFCRHKNAKIVDYNGTSLFCCSDCGTKSKI